MPKRRTFVKHIDGEPVVQVAYTEADAVRLVYDGWREQVTPKPAPRAAAQPTARAAPTGRSGGQEPPASRRSSK